MFSFYNSFGNQRFEGSSLLHYKGVFIGMFSFYILFETDVSVKEERFSETLVSKRIIKGKHSNKYSFIGNNLFYLFLDCLLSNPQLLYLK